MRFLTDETVARSTVAMLRRLGHEVSDVREIGMGGAVDEAVAARAKAEQRVIVTHDKDFGDLLRFQPGSHCGAIIVRVHPPLPGTTNSLLESFLATVPDDYASGRLVILGGRGFRSRKL